MLKTEKGITLVALIITIIVLLILAGVSIGMVTGENGLLTKSRTAVNVHTNSEIVENNLMTNYSTTIDPYITNAESEISNPHSRDDV